MIGHCKSIFARHGIPEVVVSDNGPQFSRVKTSAFSAFAQEYGFQHITSSPHYPQSNGLAEAAVKIIKKSMEKTGDPYKTLLAYRTTPLNNGYSPAELLMGRRLRSTIPTAKKMLVPSTPDMTRLRKYEEELRVKQRKAYDRRHRVQDLADIVDGTEVWVVDLERRGTVHRRTSEPRSYIVDTQEGPVRRNRTHLIPCSPSPASPNQSKPSTSVSDDDGSGKGQTRCGDNSHLHSRGGRCLKTPQRYIQ